MLQESTTAFFHSLLAHPIQLPAAGAAASGWRRHSRQQAAPRPPCIRTSSLVAIPSASAIRSVTSCSLLSTSFRRGPASHSAQRNQIASRHCENIWQPGGASNGGRCTTGSRPQQHQCVLRCGRHTGVISPGPCGWARMQGCMLSKLPMQHLALVLER